jgi:hypothetical protein
MKGNQMRACFIEAMLLASGAIYSVSHRRKVCRRDGWPLVVMRDLGIFLMEYKKEKG